MTEEEVKATIEALRKTTAEATKSKASALKYLDELGLIKDEKPSKKNTKGMFTMAVSNVDKQLLKLISHLNDSQKKSLAKILKSFVSMGRSPKQQCNN
jgi:DNA polymerase III gamma/tau subunit